MITREEIENIAILSKLEVTSREISSLAKDMQAMIDFANAVCENSPDDVQSGAECAPLSALRSDEVLTSRSKEEILMNAPEIRDSNIFLRKRV